MRVLSFEQFHLFYSLFPLWIYQHSIPNSLTTTLPPSIPITTVLELSSSSTHYIQYIVYLSLDGIEL